MGVECMKERRPAPAATQCTGKRAADQMDEDAGSDDSSRRTQFQEQLRQHTEHLDRLAQMACDAAHWRRLYQEEKRLRSELEQRLEDAMNELLALRKERLRKGARTGR